MIQAQPGALNLSQPSIIPWSGKQMSVRVIRLDRMPLIRLKNGKPLRQITRTPLGLIPQHADPAPVPPTRRSTNFPPARRARMWSLLRFMATRTPIIPLTRCWRSKVTATHQWVLSMKSSRWGPRTGTACSWSTWQRISWRMEQSRSCW